jgi:hypothetical protein
MFGRLEFIPPPHYVYHLRLEDARQLRARALRAMLRESYALGW